MPRRHVKLKFSALVDLHGPRFATVINNLAFGDCQCGHANKRDCYYNTADLNEWCDPCRVRWSLLSDASRFVAPKDDLV
jgi:hypothetical protein